MLTLLNTLEYLKAKRDRQRAAHSSRLVRRYYDNRVRTPLSMFPACLSLDLIIAAVAVALFYPVS